MLSPHQWTRESPLERERLSVEMLRKKISLSKPSSFSFILLSSYYYFLACLHWKRRMSALPLLLFFFSPSPRKMLALKTGRQESTQTIDDVYTRIQIRNNEGISSDHLFRQKLIKRNQTHMNISMQIRLDSRIPQVGL